METSHLPENEPFVAAVDVPARFPIGRLVKLEDFRFLSIQRGTARVEIDFREYELRAGSLLIMGAGFFFQCLEASDDLTISYLAFNHEIWIETTSIFDPSFFAFLKEYPVAHSLPEKDIIKYRHMSYAIQEFYEDRDNCFRTQIVKNFIQNFLMEGYNKSKALFLRRDSHNTTRQEELLERFIQLLFEHSATQRDVQFYADRLCITTRYLLVVTRRLTGESPKKMIDTRCVQEIKMLLRTTRDSMQEIAFRLGFPDQSLFARYFKKHTGLTPIEYREKS